MKTLILALCCSAALQATAQASSTAYIDYVDNSKVIHKALMDTIQSRHSTADTLAHIRAVILNGIRSGDTLILDWPDIHFIRIGGLTYEVTRTHNSPDLPVIVKP